MIAAGINVCTSTCKIFSEAQTASIQSLGTIFLPSLQRDHEAHEWQRDMTKLWVNQLKVYCDKKSTTMPLQLWKALDKDLEEQYGVKDPQMMKQS